MNKNIILPEISIIIPVKDNQEGIDDFLTSFFDTQLKENYPKEIIIVDNNSCSKITISREFNEREIDVHLLKCYKTGPAAARNVGAKKAQGNWLLFTDSDCMATESFLTGYLSTPEGGIAYAGYVIPLRENNISNYYQKINLLNPPYQEGNTSCPAHVITANCLINKKAFEKVHGFNEEFELAAGEDVDLGVRLTKIGELFYANKAIIKHNYKSNVIDFYKRFLRYGKGLIQLENAHLINVKPILNKKKSKHFGVLESLLFFLQQNAVKKGYNS